MTCKIRNNLFRKSFVVYQCDKCETELESDLKDAGNQDQCPNCGTVFVVPGIEERNKIEQTKIDKAAKVREREIEFAKEKADKAAKVREREIEFAKEKADKEKAEKAIVHTDSLNHLLFKKSQKLLQESNGKIFVTLVGDFNNGKTQYDNSWVHVFDNDKFIMNLLKQGFNTTIEHFEEYEEIHISQVEAIAIASEESVKRIGATIKWSVIGTLCLGPVGLLAGLLLGGKGKDVTFVMKFKDGRSILGKAPSELYAKILFICDKSK